MLCLFNRSSHSFAFIKSFQTPQSYQYQKPQPTSVYSRSFHLACMSWRQWPCAWIFTLKTPTCMWQCIPIRFAFRTFEFFMSYVRREFDWTFNSYLLSSNFGHIHLRYCDFQHVELCAFQGHTGPVTCVKWNPFASSVFLSCSADWSIRLWKVGREGGEEGETGGAEKKVYKHLLRLMSGGQVGLVWLFRTYLCNF